MQQIDQYLFDQAGRFEQELLEFLRIPSVSADSAFRADVRRAAEFVGGQFPSIGFLVEMVETAGHPIVYAESPAVPGAATVLVYGHYDVQPPDPLDRMDHAAVRADRPRRQRSTPAARPTTRGRCFTHIKSAEAWLKTDGQAAGQVKFLIEGEEEVGSNNLDDFLNEPAGRGSSATARSSATPASSPPACRPSPTACGASSLLRADARGPEADLHSGIFGGSVTNPVNALGQMLAACTMRRPRPDSRLLRRRAPR